MGKPSNLTSALPFALAVALGLSPVACAGSTREPDPVPDLARAREAGKAYDLLRRRFAGASREDRISLEGHVELLRRWFPDDPTTRIADVYLAWIALEKGDLERARSKVVDVMRGDPGNTRDLAALVTGAALARQGEPDAALELLLPLVGKLLDPFARDLLHDEAVKAALAAQRWRDTVDLLDAWLRDVSEEDRAMVLEIAERTLEKLPAATLEAALRDMAAEDDAGTAHHAAALEAAMARRLGAVALSRNDAELARRLVRKGGAIASLGEKGKSLVELAAMGAGTPRVAGRKVGLVLASARARAGAEALRGAMRALGLEGGGASREDEVLAVSDDRDGVPQAVASLVRSGAAVVLGGFDEPSSAKLRDLADAEHLPVVLLHASGRPASPWVHEVGPDVGAAVAPLLADLGRAATLVDDAGCAAFSPLSHGAPRPAGEAVVVLGDESCARDVAASFRGPIALGLVAAGAALPPLSERSPARRSVKPTSFATLGCFPSAEARSYWDTLAADAAGLVRGALEALPASTTKDEAEIRKRRDDARIALGAAPRTRCMGLAASKPADVRVRRP